MPSRGKSSKQKVRTGNAFVPLPLPSGVPVSMCFCGDHCKIEKSDEEETYRQRYWMCANFAFDPTPHQIHIGLLTPPTLCDFEQWIDIEIVEEDNKYLQLTKKI
ncbi:uncharacterized protein C2845_PM11G11570 [Panicum miliaceum]|uniref:Uncharacterized protein n=1 Tax=Panicum miliaceum TaxID=4540 RepID=A0A3L6RML4_PANMI|nr:uncharacterized protein C2845_PM11G11570 [Panicum miliaceum]